MSTETSITDIAIECQTHGEWVHLLDRLESLSVPFYGGENVSHYNAGDYVGFIIVPFEGVIADRIIRFELDSNKVVPYRVFSANRDFLKQLEALAGESKVKRDRRNDEIMQVKSKLWESTLHHIHGLPSLPPIYTNPDFAGAAKQSLSRYEESVAKMAGYYSKSNVIEERDDVLSEKKSNELEALVINNERFASRAYDQLGDSISSHDVATYSPPSTYSDYASQFNYNTKCREYPIHPNEAFTPYNEDEFKLKSKSKLKPSIIHIDDEEVKVIRIKRPVKRNIINIKTKL